MAIFFGYENEGVNTSLLVSLSLFLQGAFEAM